MKVSKNAECERCGGKARLVGSLRREGLGLSVSQSANHTNPRRFESMSRQRDEEWRGEPNMASRKESREWRQGTVAKRGAGRGLERWEPPALERSEERTGLLDRGETFSGDGDGDVLSGLPFPFLQDSHRFGMVRQL